MEHIKTETTNEITYYIVPENTRLYRGDTELYMRDMQLENTPTFFGLEKSRVKNYGMLFSFITLKELRLVALDKPNQAFFDQSPSDIKSILNAQFGFNKSPSIRETIREKDYKLVNYLCEAGYDGYMIDEMDVPFDMPLDEPDTTEDDHSRIDPSKFHRELALCSPMNKVQLINPKQAISKYTSANVQSLIEKNKLMKSKYALDAQRRDAKKKRRTPQMNDELMRPDRNFMGKSSIGLFGSDSDEDNTYLFNSFGEDTYSSPSKINRNNTQPHIRRVGSFESNSSSNSSETDLLPFTPVSPPRTPSHTISANSTPVGSPNRNSSYLTDVRTPDRKSPNKKVKLSFERKGGKTKHKNTKKRTKCSRKKRGQAGKKRRGKSTRKTRYTTRKRGGKKTRRAKH